MKRIVSLLATLCLFQSSHAATAVPDAISYQGRALTATGALMGAGTPVNRTVIFRIWDHPSNSLTANLIYSEQQVVTIAEGEFSVLVGTGASTANTPLGYSETTKGPPVVKISDAFGGVTRYLGVTIDDGTAAVDNEISPRQQIVSGAFALRSKVAESVDGLAITTAMLANNSVTTTQVGDAAITTSKLAANAVTTTQITDATITGAKIATDTIVAGNIQAGAVGTSEILDGTIATADIANLAVTNAKIATDTILAGNIAAGAVSTSELAASSVTYDKLAATAELTVKTTGVGINNTSPLGRFTVNSGAGAFTVGDSDLATGSWIRTSVDTVFSTNVGNMWFGYQGNAKTLNFMGGGSIPAMHIASNGNVGIGTTSPTAAKLVLSGASPTAPYSMWANGQIVSTGHITYSDERIKNIQGRSDRAKDLETLLGIEVTDYRHKDVTGNGNTPQKKVIAQQVEKVFPQAVSRARYVVPDIYQKASLKGAWISLESDLKVGDRVRLTSEQLEGIFAVLEVAKGKFRTEFSAETDEVFVYGREVSDFRVVDYDAISMLNVSATQQVKREKDAEIQTLRDENAALRRELAAKDASLEAKDAILEAKDASLETRLIALERRMAAEGANKTVSLKTAQAVK